MIFIIHGENLISSRAELTRRLTAAEANGFSVKRLDGKHLDSVTLEASLGTQDLFTPRVLVVIEDLFSLPKSKKKDELIALIHTATVDVLLWEKKTLTVTQLKPFDGATVLSFKTSSAVFGWLDMLRPGDLPRILRAFEKAADQDGAEMCFAMLCRQVRLLLQVKDGGQLKLAPFMIGKFQRQASYFSMEQLLKMHKQLLAIDESIKTSSSLLGLREQLVKLMIDLFA